MMKERLKQNLLVTAFGVSLYAILMNLSAVIKFADSMLDLILPVIAGGIIALFLNVPMNGIYKLLDKHRQKSRKKTSDKKLHVMSFIITIACILVITVMFLTLVIPELIRSSQSLYEQLQDRAAYINETDFDVQWIEDLFSAINLDSIIQNFSDSASQIISNVMSALSSTVNVVTTMVFAIIISVYILLGKQRLTGNVKTVIKAYVKPNHAEKIFHLFRTFSEVFSNFLSGQCTEAILLGVLMFIAFSITGLPYGIIVGVTTAVCAVIPYVGAFISCVVSVILTLVVDPLMVIKCLIVYNVVQFLENQLIYPRVVGGSVGLSPLYTLIAAMIGGKLFGIIGIIFFIPLAAFITKLIKEDARQRIQNRESEVKSGEETVHQKG